MKVDITIHPKTHDAHIKFDFDQFKELKDLKDSVAILSMISGDFSLDPEMTIEDFQSLIEQGKSAKNTAITFDINEDGIEAEFSK